MFKPSDYSQTEECNILVVDDDYDTCELLQHIFKRAGISVVTTQSGLEGLALARDLQPTLILMDLHMPGMSGLEATAYIKNDEGFETIQVISMTAGLLNDTKNKAFKAGSDGYIQKPFKRHELLDYVQPYLN